MPSEWDYIRLSETQDRRVKLTTKAKREISQKYQSGEYSLRGLAKEYNVSHKTILLIVNAEAKSKNDEYIKTHWMNYKPDRETRTESIRKTRTYKRKLFEKGELK